jgi:catechol 2,3-dioxygenase-like lactoylglutathione lyase family enzyme
MKFHHMCIVVADLDKAIHLWRDVLGFRLETVVDLPDKTPRSPTNFGDDTLMDRSWKVKGARSTMAWLRSRGGAQIELQRPIYPAVELTPPENLRYGHTGFHELGLLVDDIDAMFKKVKDAGYKPVTEDIWAAGPFGRSFIFPDDEGNLIQLWEERKPAQ